MLFYKKLNKLFGNERRIYDILFIQNKTTGELLIGVSEKFGAFGI